MEFNAVHVNHWLRDILIILVFVGLWRHYFRIIIIAGKILGSYLHKGRLNLRLMNYIFAKGSTAFQPKLATTRGESEKSGTLK